MTPEQQIALILGLVTGLPSLIVSIAVLVQVLKGQGKIADLGRTVNGRVDQLLQEVERRIQAESDHATDSARLRALERIVGQQRPQPHTEIVPPGNRPATGD